MPRNPATDPRPGDVLSNEVDTWTVEEFGADGNVYLTSGDNLPLAQWGALCASYGYTVAAGPDVSGGPFVDPPAPAVSPDDVLDVVERHARTLTALLTAAQIADDSRTPPWARGPAEAWLRGQFDALGGGGPADTTSATAHDPRTDPRPGDTKDWTDAEGYVHYDVVDGLCYEAGTLYGPGLTDGAALSLDEWADPAGGTAVWTAGGAS